jgi:hypothetical protein
VSFESRAEVTCTDGVRDAMRSSVDEWVPTGGWDPGSD